MGLLQLSLSCRSLRQSCCYLLQVPQMLECQLGEKTATTPLPTILRQLTKAWLPVMKIKVRQHLQSLRARPSKIPFPPSHSSGRRRYSNRALHQLEFPLILQTPSNVSRILVTSTNPSRVKSFSRFAFHQILPTRRTLVRSSNRQQSSTRALSRFKFLWVPAVLKIQLTLSSRSQSLTRVLSRPNPRARFHSRIMMTNPNRRQSSTRAFSLSVSGLITQTKKNVLRIQVTPPVQRRLLRRLLRIATRTIPRKRNVVTSASRQPSRKRRERCTQMKVIFSRVWSSYLSFHIITDK